MKILSIIILLSAAAFLSNCRKSGSKVIRSNCDGLLADTSGTGDDAKVYMPNAFTPNGDGINDISRPITIKIASIHFIIYDESNTEIFSTTQLEQGWNGNVNSNSSGKYYYKIQATTITGHHIGICGDLYELKCLPNNILSFFFEDQLTVNGFTGITHEIPENCP